MKIATLRELVQKSQQSGLSLKTRNYIKKQLGTNNYNTVWQEYDKLLKTDLLDKKPECISFQTCSEKVLMLTQIRLKRNLEKLFLISELQPKNIIDTLNALKKLAKIPINKYEIQKAENIHNIQITKVANSKKFKILSKQPKKEIGSFSLGTMSGEPAIFDFFINPQFRKTNLLKDSMLMMSKFFSNFKYENITCTVDSNKPVLIRLYEKFGFRTKSIISVNDNDKIYTFYKLTKESNIDSCAIFLCN